MLKRISQKMLKPNTSSSLFRRYTSSIKKEVIPPKSVKYWLLGCSSLVVSIVVIGGLTRLEEGGLSMVDWKPLGNLPPMNEQEWIDEFERYKQFPEFKKKNSTMEVNEFKYIYYYEYIHRMVGR
jgi:heme a synthase